jgi:hypothetical protein
MADQNALMMINPFEALETGRKRAYAGYEAGQAAAQREALNELYAQALDPRTGTIDRNKLYSGLAGRRMGAMIPGLEMEEAKLAEQRGKSMQEETKGLEGRMQYWKRLLPADPRLAPAWVSAMYADPVVGPELSRFGSAEETIAAIPQDPARYGQWMEGASMFADEYAKRRTVTAENLLQYNQPMSPEVFEQQRALRGAGAARSSTTVQLPASEVEYSKTVGKTAGEADVAAFAAAEAAAGDLTNDYRAIELLRSGKPATGITADVELQFNRLKAAVGQDKKALEKVTSTELLNALLGQDVFKNIQALGIGARGLDTPAEREYLREVVSGTISLNQQTLIKMAEIRAAIKERAIDKFNKRVESGELDRFFEAAGRPKRTIEKPSAPTAPAAAGKSYPTEAAAEAAFKAGKLKVGDRVTINGVSGTWK